MICSQDSSLMRKYRLGVFPVAGRPRFFFGFDGGFDRGLDFGFMPQSYGHPLKFVNPSGRTNLNRLSNPPWWCPNLRQLWCGRLGCTATGETPAPQLGHRPRPDRVAHDQDPTTHPAAAVEPLLFGFPRNRRLRHSQTPTARRFK